MTKLPDDIHTQIVKLTNAADGFSDKGKYPEAFERYWKAWDLLPEPKTDWEAAKWILAAVGDINILQGDFEAGRDNLSKAMHCPDAVGNPYLHLRLGQCQFELDNQERARDELARAYLIAGEELFEDEDAKYLEFAKAVLDSLPDE